MYFEMVMDDTVLSEDLSRFSLNVKDLTSDHKDVKLDNTQLFCQQCSHCSKVGPVGILRGLKSGVLKSIYTCVYVRCIWLSGAGAWLLQKLTHFQFATLPSRTF